MAFAGTQQKCKACGKTVYVVDQLTADNVVYHKACFRCHHCNGTLKVWALSPLLESTVKGLHFLSPGKGFHFWCPVALGSPIRVPFTFSLGSWGFILFFYNLHCSAFLRLRASPCKAILDFSFLRSMVLQPCAFVSPSSFLCLCANYFSLRSSIRPLFEQLDLLRIMIRSNLIVELPPLLRVSVSNEGFFSRLQSLHLRVGDLLYQGL